MLRRMMAGAVLGLALAPVVSADTIVLKNGDTLHDKIGDVSEKQIKYHADAFGDVTIDQGQVKSYKIDEPVVVQRKDQPPITASVQGEDQQLKVNDQPFTFKQIKSVNAPPEKRRPAGANARRKAAANPARASSSAWTSRTAGGWDMG